MSETVDWKSLAERLGTLRGGGEVGGTSYARQAIEILLGEENLRQAVEYYIAGKPGSELARDVLKEIRPWSAIEYCYDIYKSGADVRNRRLAVELLRAVADRRALGWVAEFLGDEDEEIQMWGAGMLEQLVYSELLSKQETGELLEKMDEHENPSVRETAESIKRHLERN